jgi:molybdopterin molybdotransferase
MIPAGATGMIMIEHTEKMDSETLLISKPITNGENVVYKAEDIKKGEIILRNGQKIGTKEIGVLASLGIYNISVFKKPRVYIISTGDEIVDIKDVLEPGKIRDINSYTLESLVIESGGTVSGKEIVRDEFQSLLHCVEKAIAISDIVLLSGGSSVGTRDFTHKVIEAIGGRGIFVHGLAIKPGKPTIIGDGKGKLIVGLPGHPVSSIVVYKAIIEPFIKGLLDSDEILPRVMAKTAYNFPSSPGKQTYHMVKLKEEGGELYAIPSFGKSGMITLLSQSQGYIVIKEHEEGINKGELREVFLL